MAQEKKIKLGRNAQHEIKLSTAKITHRKIQIQKNKANRRNKYSFKHIKFVKLDPETLNLLEIVASKKKKKRKELRIAEIITLKLFLDKNKLSLP